jgi:MATE family multidrug resistance protein
MKNYEYNIREVLKFSIPLVLTSLSVSLMFNVDRLVLARYSLNSMNAAALGGNFVAMASFLVVSIAQIATVFVGQYNGIGEYKKTGWAPWQMIHLGLLSFLVFIPLAIFCHHLNIFPDYCRSDGIKYVKTLAPFAGLQAISAALSAFFVGRGKSFIIIFVVIATNILNFALNVSLVFGIEGYLDPMGIVGSAIATVTSEIVYVLILLIIFLSKRNREVYNTFDYKFRKKLFFDCIKTGLPLSMGKLLSLLAWFVILSIFSYTSRDMAIIETFAVSVWVIFIFFADGSGRALSSLSANLIGRNDLQKIRELLALFLKLNVFVCLIFSIPLIFYQDIMFWFIDGAQESSTHLRSDFQFVFVSMWLVIFTDGIYYLICGILNSGGDTKFPMCLELTTLWAGCVLPTAMLYFAGNLTTIRITYTLLPIIGIINAVVVYFRYKKLKWFTRIVGSGT